MNKQPLALMAKAALLFASCCTPCSAQATVVTTTTATTTTTAVAPAPAAWTTASYDANGYPIYGYAYGQPVYGYSAAGVAITNLAALTALCYIPNWGPASWYRGPAYAPNGLRFAAPPKYSQGHSPNVRPSNNAGGPSNHGGGGGGNNGASRGNTRGGGNHGPHDRR